jgi:hypothetical protein
MTIPGVFESPAAGSCMRITLQASTSCKPGRRCVAAYSGACLVAPRLFLLPTVLLANPGPALVVPGETRSDRALLGAVVTHAWRESLESEVVHRVNVVVLERGVACWHVAARHLAVGGVASAVSDTPAVCSAEAGTRTQLHGTSVMRGCGRRFCNIFKRKLPGTNKKGAICRTANSIDQRCDTTAAHAFTLCSCSSASKVPVQLQ